ncbi:TonB-dependent receptor [Pseudomaricurvus alcaniphilus]|uniref:TonB-dependent receptor domain-containing protein n=1 Tax=Pseudomaricurvus alcaniphilus TaxID=1166482 RepID=UPI001408CDCA|nr:TonB-dependent receptor [Pseudomaricurvus alcaniphilus]NHN37900.1 TonB-dependent receptor [Pseudomaricurvus alcaniphilus]
MTLPKPAFRLSLLALAVAAASYSQIETAQAADSSVIEEVMVTGSRIVRKDYASSSPVTTVDTDAIQASGSVELEGALNQMPQFGEGATGQTNAIGGGGGASLNLRSLGTNRNLVLLDGRRLPIASAFGEVDINMVPSALVRNVEVLTGGASSVYGSEAISGVVNFQSKSDYEGLELDIQYGDSFDGGLEKNDVSLLGGASIAEGRGHAMIALGRTERTELRGSDRDFFRFAVPSSFIGQGTFRSGGNAPSQAALNALFAGYGVSGTPGTDQIGFNDDGTLFSQGNALNYKGPTNAQDPQYWVQPSGAVRMPVGQQGLVIKPLERYTAFAKFDYDLTENVTGYAQYMYANSTTEGNVGGNITLQGPTALVPVTNPFIPGDLATLLASRPDPGADFILNKRFMSINERAFDEQFITSQYLVGLKGDVGFKDWTFDAYVARDAMDSTESNINSLLGSRLNSLLQAADGGASICEGGFNPFGLANSAAISPECQAYLAPTTISTLETRRTTFEGTVTGSLFAIPAGEVMYSLTYSYRKDSLDYAPSISLSTDDVLGRGPSFASSGETVNKEIGGELLVPLLQDAPLVQSLDLTLGYRVSDQDVTGDFDSWKVGLEWRPTDSVFVRGSVQQAVRAPNIGELFSSSVGSEVTVGNPPTGGDPCDVRTESRNGADAADIRNLCLAQGISAAQIDTFQHTTTSMPTSAGGNLDLKPEVADTMTIGFVWEPALDNQELSIAVDYWSIEIEDVINTINGNDAIAKCFSSSSNPGLSNSNEFCQLISRESATGTVSRIETNYLNLAALRTDGIDVQATWGMDVGPGALKVNGSLTWLNSYEEQALPGEDFLDYKGTIDGPANRAADNNVHPEWSALIAPSYAIGPAEVTLRWRYTHGMEDRDTVLDSSSQTPGVSSFSYFDLSGKWTFNENYTLRGGITNLFDKAPPIVGGGIGDTRAGTYDIVGRSFFVGFNASF